MDEKRLAANDVNAVAGNGLLDRRSLLGAAATGSITALIACPAADRKSVV